MVERQRRREQTAKGENRRKEQQHRREWQTVQVRQRPPTDAKQHRPKDDSNRQGVTKKGGRAVEERELQADLSPPPSRCPTPHRRSSSSSSSHSDSESERPITRVPADSTSNKRLAKRGQQGAGRPDASRPKAAPPRVATAHPSEGQQSEAGKKLYTLVPFGRGDKAAGYSQRGLRNLVVQIDLCLLKRVPDSTSGPAVKKPSSSHSTSLLTKDRQRDTMKHLYTPETVTKDGKRKRKVDNVYFMLTSANKEIMFQSVLL